VTIPDYQTLMLPVLEAAAEREWRVPELAEVVADGLGLTTDEREELLPSGRQRILHNRIHWAKFYMSKAGLIDTPARGRFIASEAGRALLATRPERIDVSALMQYPAFLEFYTSSQTRAGDAGPATPSPRPAEQSSTPEEQIETAYAAVLSALRAELLERIGQNSPAFFEQLIVELLVAMGYGGSYRDASQQLGRSGDGGVDGVVNEDPLGLDRVYVQAKRYAKGNTVGRSEVQGFLGSLVGLGAAKGVFVTTSTFSPQARDFARHLPQRVILIDGEQLAELMVEHGVGVRTSRAVTFRRLDEDFFIEEG
jgi:restriction system protein